MNANSHVFIGLMLIATLAGCKKDEEMPPPPAANEEEVITTMVLRFLSTSGGADKELRFTDADGDGGNAPVLTLDTLDAATGYDVSIFLLNESTSPTDTISHEVLDEGVLHQFFFAITGVDLSVAYADTDANGQPIGLSTMMTTGVAGSGNLRVTLRHMPNKDAAGVAGGDITNAGGETDIEVDLPMVVE